MIVKIGFKTWDTRDWIQGEELGDKTLACPDCGSRIILKYYDMACGTKALNFCPYCGKARRPKEGENVVKIEDASCENCEHAYRGADPLKILQDSGNVFCCSAGFKYGGADTVCTEWKRKEGEQ